MESPGARVLFVSDERAWPRRSGYRRRTALILGALAEVATVTWLLVPRRVGDDGAPPEVPDRWRHRIEPLLAASPDRSRLDVARRWATTGLPWPLAAGDWSEAERVLAGLRSETFDLLWSMGVDALAATRRAGVRARRTIVDADLESLKLERALAADPDLSGLRRLIARVDVGRWRRLEQDAAAGITTFSLCSETERRFFGHDAWVTPNAYDVVDGARLVPGGRPRPDRDLLFVGLLDYPPNRDAVRYFANEVLPAVRRRSPDTTFRVIGAGVAAAEEIGSAPGVRALGPVDDLGPELATAAAVVVPVRWGAGTRVKILEAFAHRIPVVSTTVGAEGLDVTDGRELLIADDAGSLADACLAVLGDADRAASLAEAGHRALVERYSTEVVAGDLIARLRGLFADDGNGPDGRGPGRAPVAER